VRVRRATVIGRIAAVLAVCLGAAGCGLVGGGGGGYDVTVYFARGVALYEQGQVRVLGLPAGRVEEVVTEQSCPVDGADRPCVRVELKLDEDVALPADVAATLIPQSLIGERYVQLTPAYTDDDDAAGRPRLSDLPEDERVIPLSRAIIPVEPDEALAALNEFLQSLDPDGLGRLITNAEEDLRGNGESVNQAIGGLADLVETFAERDQELASIVENFDVFAATLVTREAQIGEVIESFARTTNLLAQERNNLELLLAGLARVSNDGFDLVAEHAVALRTDLASLSDVGQSLVANLDAVTLLLDAGPLLADGLADAFNPTLRAINLRTQFGPIAQLALEPVLQSIFGDDFQVPCIPIDTACSPLLPVAGQAASVPVPTDVPTARTPIDDVLDLLAAPSAPGRRQPAPSTADRVADGASALGGWLRDAAEALTGVDG